MFALDSTLLKSGPRTCEQRVSRRQCEDAIDGVIFAVALSKGCLTRLVVDERQPAPGQDGRERRKRQNLGDDLEDVDGRLPGCEVVEEPL